MVKYAADQVKSGKRLRQIITRGLKLQARIEDLAQKKMELETELMAIISGFEGRGKTDPIELTAGDDVPGKVAIKWGFDYVVDPKQAQKLRKQLGDAEFNRCFSTKTSFSRARSQSTWLKEAHGKLDRFKDAIKGAVTKVVRKKPTIKWVNV